MSTEGKRMGWLLRVALMLCLPVTKQQPTPSTSGRARPRQHHSSRPATSHHQNADAKRKQQKDEDLKEAVRNIKIAKQNPEIAARPAVPRGLNRRAVRWKT